MATMTKPKPSDVASELRSMIEVRRQAEQRAHFEPIGRLLYLKTEHGNILWPVDQEHGECIGPDVASLVQSATHESGASGEWLDLQTLLLLGAWLPLPPIRTQSSKPCSKCLHVCEVCNGAKTKQCEQAGCGGRGKVAIDGQLPCDAPGCSAQTGSINPEGCAKCRNTGTMPRLDHCAMCDGTGKMKCPRCRGRGQVATGKLRGSIDWKAKDCPACGGSGWKGAFKPQNAEKFRNAEVALPAPGKPNVTKVVFWALGPIYEMGIEDPQTHATRIFDVGRDSVGDYLMLLVPAPARGRTITKAKAYLVGGVVRERASGQGAA
jgi:hypothetical protein